MTWLVRYRTRRRRRAEHRLLARINRMLRRHDRDVARDLLNVATVLPAWAALTLLGRGR